MLVMSPEDFQTFALPDSEDAIGILLAGPSNSTADTITTASENFGSWGGTYTFSKTVKYIAKGGVSSVHLYLRGAPNGELPPCLKIGADRGLFVEYYYASFNGSGNLIEDSEGGAVVVFVYGWF